MGYRGIRATVAVAVVLGVVVAILAMSKDSAPSGLTVPEGGAGPTVVPGSAVWATGLMATSPSAVLAPNAPGKPATTQSAVPGAGGPVPTPNPIPRPGPNPNPGPGPNPNPNPNPNPEPAVVCPAVEPAIEPVPAGARNDVNRELANLDAGVRDANQRLPAARANPDPDYVQNTILGPLADRRVAILDRIAIAIGRFGPRPQGLARLAPCAVR